MKNKTVKYDDITKKKYQILIDYGLEGMRFWDDGHDELDEAVKVGTKNSYGSDFYIVQIIDWKATNLSPERE